MSKKLKRPIAFIATLAMILSMLLYLPSGVMTDIGFGLAVSAEDVTGTTSGEGNTPADTGTTGGTGETPANTDGTGETPDNTDNGEDSIDEPAAVESESVMLLAEGAADFTPTKPTAGDGSSTNPYQISNANELYWFAALVNGTLTDGTAQSTAAWAKLTANITVNNNVLVDGALNTTNSGSFTSWTPIGNYSSQYTGTFDGQNNTISGLYFDNGNTRYVGLFGCVGSGGNVSNVGIVDSYFNGNRYAGGVCGNNYGTIKNCYNTGAVSGNDNHAGGVCGYNNGGTIQNCYNTGAVSGKWKVGGVCGYNYNSTIQNCYSTGTVSGWSNIGGVCGYNDGSTITNCYFDSYNYSEDAVGHIYSGTITYVEGKTTTQFESGEVCYLLQSGQENDSESGKAPMVWGQTIGTDKAPVLTSDSKKTVYRIGVTYSNTNSEITEHEHNFGANFRCNNCGSYEAPELKENVYEITNASQLYWFAEYVNNGNTSAEAILKNNIVVNENVLVENGNLVGDTSNFVSWTPIGNSLKQYTGTFNGNGKTISGLYFDDSGTDCVGLFGYVGISGNVSNVGVVASYFKGKNNVGGVCGNNNGTIQNCYSTGGVSGSNNVGGVCGNNNGTIKNCYNTGVVSGSENVGGVCGNNNGGTITNCYFDSNNYGGGAVGSTDGGTITDVEGKTTNAFEKGEVCYLLQSGQEKDSESEEAPMVWGQTIDGQTIDIDKAPVLTSDSAKTVYPKTTGCVASYSNTNSEITEKSHSNLGADFRCTDCGNYVAPELNENVYEITNASQLYWFAKYVNKGNTSAKAILKENIVVNENVLGADGKLVSDTSKFVSWTPIGSESKQYTGTFNGNGKTISGLYFDNNGTDCVGLFGYVGKDGNVSNVGVVASYFKGKDNVGGVCGYNDGTIKNCYNTGAVSGSMYVGGVCGYNDWGTITNCYNTGAVSGSYYVGGVCGYNDWGTITNCYNTGAVSGSDNVGGVCGYNVGGTITNCYYLTGTATGGINGTDDVANNVLVKNTTQFTFGEVAYLLSQGCTTNTNTYSGEVWGQDLSAENSYPVLGGAKVYQTTPCVSYTNSENTVKEHTDGDSDNICDNCDAKYTFKVETVSSAEGGDVSSVAKLDGGGNIKNGESTTITASAVPGYTFNGWYNGETPLSADLSFVYTPTADITLTAKYTANAKMTVNINGGENFTLRVNDVETAYDSNNSQFAVGTKLTVTANGENFAYWQNEAGSVLSRSAEYTFTVVGKATVTAVYNTKVDSKAIVNFISGYDQIIDRYQITAEEDFTVPAAPTKTGCDFAGWSINGGAAVTENVADAVKAAITAALETEDTADDIINVKATYTTKVQKVTITVTNGDGGGEYNVNDVVTVTASVPASGYKFSHWTDGTNTLSYNTSYSFYAAKDITLTAVYVEEAATVEAKGTTEIVDVIKDTVNGKISFVSMSTVPEGCKIQNAGLVATMTAGDFDATNARAVKVGTTSASAYRYTWTVPVSSTDVIYVRAYLVYSDKNGNVHTIYGDIVTGSLNG